MQTNEAFISTEFCNWKDAKVAFRKCEQTKWQTVVVLPRDYEDCALIDMYMCVNINV